MTELFRRIVTVKVAGLAITEPAINFEIERHADESTPDGKVEVFNLSRGHENLIYERRGPISIEAGYPSTIAVIFEGNVSRVERERAHDQRITRIEMGGMLALSRVGSVTMRSYRGVETIRRITADLVKDMGLQLGPIDNIPADASVRDWAWKGRPDFALSFLLRRVGLTYYEDDGAIKFNRRGVAAVDAPEIDLSPSTGLIGTPSITDTGPEVVSLLEPRVRIGSMVNLRSETLSGTFKVVTYIHRGDNWKGSFETHYDMRELNAG